MFQGVSRMWFPGSIGLGSSGTPKLARPSLSAFSHPWGFRTGVGGCRSIEPVG